jgi:High-affinity Fe2+/Pb2+ permease
MITPFVISLREGLEIFLIIIPLIVFFNKNKMYDMTKNIFLGAAVGFVLSIIIGGTLFLQAAEIQGQASVLFDGLLGLILSLLVLYSVVILRKSKIFSISANEQYTNLSKKGVFILAGVTVFREMLETTLFILASSSVAPYIVAFFVLLGLMAAATIVYIASKGLAKLNFSTVFYFLNIFLVCLGAYYFGDGLEVLFGNYIEGINKIGIFIYAVPSLILIVKKDLKKLLEYEMKKK